jgi:hypothetical protein
MTMLFVEHEGVKDFQNSAITVPHKKEVPLSP